MTVSALFVLGGVLFFAAPLYDSEILIRGRTCSWFGKNELPVLRESSRWLFRFLSFVFYFFLFLRQFDRDLINWLINRAVVNGYHELKDLDD